MFKIIGLCAAALMLGACESREPRGQVPSAPVETPPERISSLDAFRIDPTQSELRVLVYRAGPLARLGHNHVMVNRALHGEVDLNRELTQSSFTLAAPVAAFTVDDVEARHEEGPDFAAEVPDDARSGTFRNMTSMAVLDAAEFPDITVKSIAVQDRILGADAARNAPPDAGKILRNDYLVTVALTVRAREATLQVPVMVQVDSGRVIAIGVAQVRQSDLGITPYSLMMGALQVEDLMTIKFRIVATRG